MLPHYLAGMILNQGDRVMIDRMVGRSEVALYGVAYSVGMLAQIFVSAVNSAITPWLYAKVGSHKTDEIKSAATGRMRSRRRPPSLSSRSRRWPCSSCW